MTSTALLRHERSSLECVSDDDGPATRCNRRIIVPRYGGPDVMTVIQEPLPEPGPEEVRVRILVAGVGYPDVQIREGTYPGGPKPPFTPGYEFIGIVDKLGAGVEAFKLGQRVGAITVYGSHADYLCVPAWWLVPVPDGLDPAEAAIVVFNYVTAYQMLHRSARVREGERLLVHGAAGGVGTAVLQLGRLAGLELYGTAREPRPVLFRPSGRRRSTTPRAASSSASVRLPERVWTWYSTGSAGASHSVRIACSAAAGDW